MINTHLELLEANEIDITEVPALIQQKMEIYTLMQNLMDDANSDELVLIDKELKEMDKAIQIDILGEFENKQILKKNKPEKGDSANRNVKGLSSDKANDERILAELFYSNHVTGLKKTFLEKIGLITELGDYQIEIGAYVLKKTAVFTHVYDLETITKPD